MRRGTRGSWSAGHVLLLDLGGGYMITSCDNSSNSTLLICALSVTLQLKAIRQCNNNWVEC